MRGSKGLVAILALVIMVLLVYAFIDGGSQEPRWIEEELPVQAGQGLAEDGA
ncbi:hypothetical protein [Croceicoccus ponticola]|uniref:hypothetical protein n=1 Tax=Croceicoccus ponticola TaxID=2217664 RepID=UPI0013E3C7DD|nr:hypothetical protein [Croceicoccus ponticola]